MTRDSISKLEAGSIVMVVGAMAYRLDSATFIEIRCDKALVEFKAGTPLATRRLVPFSRIQRQRSES